MSQPAHLILVAYQCAPEQGSVSQIGWEWYQRLAARLPVTLITHVRNRTALEQAGSPLAHSRIVYIDSEWFAGPLYRLSQALFPRSEHVRFMLASLDYFLFDYLACQQLRSLPMPAHTVLHRVTPVSPSAASLLPRLGYPTIIGPLNGGLGRPAGFKATLRAEHGWAYPLAALGRWLDRLRHSSDEASRVLYATRATRDSLPTTALPHATAMLENGVDIRQFQALPWPEAPSRTRPLQLGFVGRLIPVKGITFLLDACHALQEQGWPVALDIVGDGPLRASLQQQASARQLAVRFLGQLPHDAVAASMRDWHALVLPSLRESGGAVLMEAMACARPCIVFDWGGPAELVDDEVGRKIAASDEAGLIAGLQAAFADICQHAPAWQQRAQAARLRAEQHFDWQKRSERMLQLYAEVLQQHEVLPCNISFTSP